MYFTGLTIEPISTNLCLQSQTIETTWAKITAADSHTSNAILAPDHQLTGDLFLAANEAVGVEHGISQAITLTATVYTFSVWLQKQDYDFCFLRNRTIANGVCWFNLTTGAVATKQAGITAARVEAWKGSNTWFRLSIT